MAQHRRDSPQATSCGVITVSDSRDLDSDRGGTLICQMLEDAGHTVAAREIVPDEPQELRAIVEQCVAQDDIEIVLITGGTGISRRDQTAEALEAMYSKQLPGYGELFRWLSYQEVGPAAMLSRASAGIVDRVPVCTMPGSPSAVRLAMERLILPEIGHLVAQASK